MVSPPNGESYSFKHVVCGECETKYAASIRNCPICHVGQVKLGGRHTAERIPVRVVPQHRRRRDDSRDGPPSGWSEWRSEMGRKT